jgi:hypothetical protein
VKLLFSSDKSTIANVITTMDKVDDLITTMIVSTQPSGCTKHIIHPSIRKVLGLAKVTMNKYYSATDTSNVYHIAMGMCFHQKLNTFLTRTYSVLYPSLKLQYFKSHKWDDAWITTAKNLVSEEYKTYLAAGHGVDDVEIAESDVVSFISGVISTAYSEDRRVCPPVLQTHWPQTGSAFSISISLSPRQRGTIWIST